ncbi:MAG TPA: phytanoyl-CoA dioxygenase family protein [Acidimicrobiales bacterium]|jgi:ectoine hydroxylase-related dioxygenase (phytanoyl-CoA dioxygenase family)|nr:phytanoyl-CoA dioxygenase family protein [Acidimicrobiales bacterium]
MRATPAVQSLDASTDADAVAAVLAEDGCVVVERLVPPDTMDAIHDELATHIDATTAGPDEFSGFNTRRTGSLIARSPSFRPIAMHPLVLATLDRVLGEHTTNYQLHLTQVIDIGPGEPAQLVHRDQWAFDFFPFPQGYEVECHMMWAMSDFTEANGATRVIPGSHKWADKLRPDHSETVGAAMPKGSVFMYVGSVYHGGGANRSDEHRVGINVGYTLAWLRQEENQYLACPPEIARELPIELAKLVGYSRAAYALGYFGDLQDPLEAVYGRDSGKVGFSAQP